MEYSDSKEWAKAQYILLKGVLNNVPTEQWCWKTMKGIMGNSTADFEQKIEVAKKAWCCFLQLNFPEANGA